MNKVTPIVAFFIAAATTLAGCDGSAFDYFKIRAELRLADGQPFQTGTEKRFLYDLAITFKDGSHAAIREYGAGPTDSSGVWFYNWDGIDLRSNRNGTYCIDVCVGEFVRGRFGLFECDRVVRECQENSPYARPVMDISDIESTIASIKIYLGSPGNEKQSVVVGTHQNGTGLVQTQHQDGRVGPTWREDDVFEIPVLNATETTPVNSPYLLKEMTVVVSEADLTTEERQKYNKVLSHIHL